MASIQASLDSEHVDYNNFVDMLAMYQSSFNDGIEVDIDNLFNLFYLGPLYIGTPNSMPVKVVYDTGSTWLVLKSTLCEKCASKVYDPKNSTSSHTNGDHFGQTYGSADLKGVFYNDTVCLDK